jgi:transcriptional antiterminator RfaH
MTFIPASAQWYVVQTQPNAERRAVAHLDRQGFQTYLPRYRKRRRHARRLETVIAPLFPRYLFVAVDLSTQRWRSIQSTIGVSRLVCNGDRPAAVPPQVIADISAQEDDAGLVRIDTRPRFVRGDKVRILYGAFQASLGIFEGMADEERVSILLDLLGRKVRVRLDAEGVAAA